MADEKRYTVHYTEDGEQKQYGFSGRGWRFATAKIIFDGLWDQPGVTSVTMTLAEKKESKRNV